MKNTQQCRVNMPDSVGHIGLYRNTDTVCQIDMSEVMPQPVSEIAGIAENTCEQHNAT